MSETRDGRRLTANVNSQARARETYSDICISPDRCAKGSPYVNSLTSRLATSAARARRVHVHVYEDPTEIRARKSSRSSFASRAPNHRRQSDSSRFSASVDRPRYRKISPPPSSPRPSAPRSRSSGVLPSGRPQKWSYIASASLGIVARRRTSPTETDASRTSARPFIPLNATFTCIMSPP